VLGTDLALYTVVSEGAASWRIAFTREMRGAGLLISDDICNQMFEVFCAEVRRRHQADQTAQQIAAALREHIAPEPPPLTEAEIIDSLEVDSASSDDGRRYLYGDYSPEHELEKLKDEAKKDLKH
jgi:hypothetical protein